MSNISCFYYLTESGRSQVKDFIDSLDQRTQRKFFFIKGLLEEFGRSLPEPHAKHIGNEIFELRFRGQKGNVRIMYFFFHHDKVIFTNGFIKKTNKAPKKEINTAIERKKSFLERHK
ncbi:MAG: type II toxin-antitoxin system RelE/ParE family toxin [Candidatus Omnitrophota bacterium]